MAQTSETPLRHRIANALSTGLQKARIPLLVIVAVGVVFIIAYTIYSEVNTKRIETATALAETLQTDYSSWQNESDSKTKTKLDAQIAGEIQSILKKYPGTYAAQRALFVQAGLAYDKKDWKSAEASYEEVATRFPNSYLATVSLANAAAAAEENGDPKKAIELDKKVLLAKGLAPEIPRAIFSLGRLYEGQGDVKEANTYYNKLVDSYPSSGWTNLARDRIIFLAAQEATSGIKPIGK
ncbi:MAG TPA: tetratricopeptide repeat protein [Spirochaetia bacterium]|nr:tetratricopeptide repeat protein [Spirochaetia bacterium]